MSDQHVARPRASPENYAPRVYPFSLATKLRAAREDLSNPRTKLYVWTIAQRLKDDLRELLVFRQRGGEVESPPATTPRALWPSSIACSKRGMPGRLEEAHLDQLLKLSVICDQLYYEDRAGGFREVDRIVASLPPSSAYPRIAFSNAFKAAAGGDAINDFSSFETLTTM